MRFGSLGAGMAIADSELDDMIAEADPKSQEALAQRQQAVVAQRQQAVQKAKTGNTTRNVILALAAIGGAYYLMKKDR